MVACNDVRELISGDVQAGTTVTPETKLTTMTKEDNSKQGYENNNLNQKS